MKKIILILMVFLNLFVIANGADFYSIYNPVFSAEKPNSIQVEGAECLDTLCSNINSNKVELYNGDDFQVCWNNYKQNKDANQFTTCVNNSKINGNVVDLTKTNTIVVKESTNNSFGTLKEFFPSEDSYLVKFDKTFDYNCNFDVCIDENIIDLVFEKKANAIAEIGQLNIKNLDDPLKPVQVEVPVKIEETVCSAFRFSDPNLYRFTPLNGYSDYSANTLVTLNITDPNTGQVFRTESITIPILADTCAGLAAFSWRPDSSFEGKQVKFEVRTDVIDNQVSSSFKDFANVIETVYLENLDGSCWNRAYDFTLSNKPTFTMTPSLNQITVGESLYALFKSGAWRDNSVTPMDFEALVYFNGNLVYSDLLSTNGQNLSDYSIDLTSQITNLGPGENEVKLVTKPAGFCSNISAPVIQTQKLQLLAPDKYNVRFFVKDENLNNVDGALINLKLISADDYYVQTPVYNQNRTTSNGIALFNEVIAGNYTYKVTDSNYNDTSGTVTIGSNMDIYITLYKNNSAPVIDLPDNFTSDYRKPIEFNLRDYVRDYNENFNNLQVDYQLLSGNPAIVYNNGFFNIVSSNPQEAELEISVQDSSGVKSKDVVKLYFIDNKAPVINSFTATPSSGDAPLNVMFNLDVTDPDSTNLNCRIDFGDNTYIDDLCSNLDGLSHTYNNPYTYVATLTVNDGANNPVESSLNIFVYEKGTKGPKIDYFYMSSTNGFYLPTNLTFDWSVSHPLNYPLTCALRFNGIETSVPCNNPTGYKVDDFNTPGTVDFNLIVTDNESNMEIRTLTRTFVSLDAPPVINSFTATPTEGVAPLNVSFNIVVSDDNTNNLSCRIDFGDGSNIEDLCSNLNGISHIYNNPFSYVAILTVRDGVNGPVTQSLNIQVNNPSTFAPIINYFTMNSSNGKFVPTNLTFNWAVTHPLNYSMTCNININGVLTPVSCNGGNYMLNDFNITGISNFILIVEDNLSNIVTESISEEFANKETAKLENLDMYLFLSNSVVPGSDFEFSIFTRNETLYSRDVYLIPEIECGGIVNKLKYNGGILETSGKSRNLYDEFKFIFKTNTNDFKLNVPVGENCIFRVQLFDNFGFNYSIEKAVIFEYPKEVKKVQSIRGKSVDLINYLSEVTSKSFNKGFNQLSFNIENNAGEGKDISISITSRELNLNIKQDVQLSAYQSREVSIPLFIDKSKGMYPVRISIYDGEDRQIRYTYLNIN